MNSISVKLIILIKEEEVLGQGHRSRAGVTPGSLATRRAGESFVVLEVGGASPGLGQRA